MEKILARCQDCQYWSIQNTLHNCDSPFGRACRRIYPDQPQSALEQGSAKISDPNYQATLVTRAEFGCQLFEPRI